MTFSPTGLAPGYAGGVLLVAGLLAVLLALKYVPSVLKVLLFRLAFVLTCRRRRGR
ncbi:hypothetical protein ACWKSP_14035 [Micromonosporaceae bacterium Da 78-11]